MKSINILYINIIFFFQAEDGIRDRDVTGVQTCALPISSSSCSVSTADRSDLRVSRASRMATIVIAAQIARYTEIGVEVPYMLSSFAAISGATLPATTE